MLTETFFSFRFDIVCAFQSSSHFRRILPERCVGHKQSDNWNLQVMLSRKLTSDSQLCIFYSSGIDLVLCSRCEFLVNSS